MKRFTMILFTLIFAVLLTACSGASADSAVDILLQDGNIQVNGTPASTDAADAVYLAHDIVYYPSGRDFTFGEGTDADSHSEEEAAAHTVVHITQPGSYRIRGTLSQGQIAVDLGNDAREDPNAVVTLILDGADITCTVAPAVIFYNVYECGKENAGKDVDTAAAGANVILADGSTNLIRGSYVARIYKPDSVELNKDGTEVKDAKKLHKYDGAFYSRMSMNIGSGPMNSGVLNLFAENEGLDSEYHLTINGGTINILSGNDGINTNADGVSVFTMNNGTLAVTVTGQTGEGDGIDSNGWLVVNGGTIHASACSDSADAGIDSDMGIHINGGTVIATGHMLDHIEAGGQTYAVFSFAQAQPENQVIFLQDEANDEVLEYCPSNTYSVLVYSAADLVPGTYTLWSGETQLAGQSGGASGRPGFPGGNPEGMEFPEGALPPDGMEVPEGMMPPEDGNRPEPPKDPPFSDRTNPAAEISTSFSVSAGPNRFGDIRPEA